MLINRKRLGLTHFWKKVGLGGFFDVVAKCEQHGWRFYLTFFISRPVNISYYFYNISYCFNNISYYFNNISYYFNNINYYFYNISYYFLITLVILFITLVIIFINDWSFLIELSSRSIIRNISGWNSPPPEEHGFEIG